MVSFYGNRYFKIKVSGDLESDLGRLENIARVLDHSIGNYHVTLDGNEQFTDGEQVSRFLDELLGSPDLNRLSNAVLYLEQPINRSRALGESVELLSNRMPVIIDESDGELSAFVQAKELGYSGVSSKACKGIYKSIVNRARCEVWNAAQGEQFFMSAEDLTCEPGICLQQDLCLVSLLGMHHVERNAHHFIDGFGGRPSSESEAFARSHPDLYRKDDGRIRLNIRDGSLDIRSLGNPGFGTLNVPELSSAEEMPRSIWPLKENHE